MYRKFRAWEFSELVETCRILTTEANAVLRPIHDRMQQVILRPEDYDRWLNPNKPPSRFRNCSGRLPPS